MKVGQRIGKEESVKFPCGKNTFKKYCAKRLVMGSAVKEKQEESKSSRECIKAVGAKFGQELTTRLVNCATRCFVRTNRTEKWATKTAMTS